MKLEPQQLEPVSLTFHSALRKLNTQPPIGASHQVLVIWLNSYKKEDIQKSTNQKQEWPVVAKFIDGSELNEQSLQMTFQGWFLPSFDSFDQAVSEKKILQKSTNQKQELPMAAMFVNGSELNQQLYKGLSKDTSYRFSIHLVKRFQRRRFFRNQSIRNKNCLWRPCLLTDWN